ncbi:hypothetical protein MN608_06398 [Microdochium nivale]|nr:hypothetical protein MN608_06398 [Microdochium nivale]
MSTSGSSGASRSPTPFEDASSQVMRQSSQSEDGGGSDDEPQLPGTLAALARCGGKAGLAKLRRALIQKDRKLRSHEAVAQRLKAEREYISSVISDLEEIEQAAGRVLQAMSTIEGLEE